MKTLTVAPLTQRWPVVLASLALSVSCVAAVSQSPSDRITGLEVDGTVFRIRLASGNVLTGRDLAGATLTLTQPGDAGPRRVRVESVETDPLDSDHEVLLYHLLSVDDPGREPVELCGPDMRGERWAFPIRGQWDAEGNHVSDAGYTLTCGDGAQGKCVRFGYKPWKTTAAGVSLSAFYQACIRLVRAGRRAIRGGVERGRRRLRRAHPGSGESELGATGNRVPAAQGPVGRSGLHGGPSGPVRGHGAAVCPIAVTAGAAMAYATAFGDLIEGATQ